MRILLAEDDPLLGDGLQAGLRQLGFQVDWVRDGIAAELELRADPSVGNHYAAAILDLGLPRKDGIDVLTALRSNGIHTPVLILTARDAVHDRVKGLNLGADDYVIKPVDLEELAARLRALVRRSHGQTQDAIRIQDVALDPTARTVKRGEESIALSAREFDLLMTMMLSADRVLSREQLEKSVYSWGQEVESNTVEVYIHNLRKKLGPGLIHTVRGVGYLFQKEANA
jgi:two-component system OmpR family response regulator/two-component system response regulator QseB